MTDQTEKPKLGTRPPLGLKRTVETGKVKQSFSHGRSNTVVVEVKKRRILGRPGEAARRAEAQAGRRSAQAGAEAAPAPEAPRAQAPGRRHHRAARSCRRSCCARPRKRA
jgi:translation initiation factor IF-2